jgi:H/ACA ribonucleoprotein complex subunit 3
MHFQIRKCLKCKKYTLKDECSSCNEKTHSVHPAKFSPDDKYMKYRIANKYTE